MLKRQRPVTPPPSSLGDPSSLPDGPIRSHFIDPSQPRLKRRRILPPPLDGALRGWPRSDPESDGEEDWLEDAPGVPPPSTIAGQYKDTNSLLHELHVLNQHRFLFIRDRRLNSTLHTHMQHPPLGDTPAIHTDASPPSQSQFTIDYQSPYIGSKGGLVAEVQCVQQRYEDANRLLGSLFLSRRREMERAPMDTSPRS